ncbi:unnamed protein product [Nezara viridula]|uniref:Uncharacterized protein n=1 Tax=Nezara viridula TaxID=85310 RepID=A0A9P0HS07_NEZVI|nr:unnamed protein product [Nezara viridula]
MCGCKMPLSSSNLNILDLCRLCLGKDNNLIPVLNNNVIGNQLCDKISVCLTVEIKNEDEVSQKICNHCLTKVDSFFEFRNSTLECQKVLQRWASGEKQKTIESENAALNSKDISKGIKEKDNTELNKTNECDKSEVENNSRGHSDSRYDEENVTQELIRFYKSLASEGQTPASVISREREVPGPSGIQECNKKSPPENNVSLNDDNQKKRSADIDSCPVCKKTFQNSENLLKHEEKHLGNIQCEICSKKFASLKQLSVHNRRHLKKYVCSYCNYASHSSSNFKIHLMKHNQQYLIECEDCGKGFYNLSYYREHRSVKHSNEIVVNKCKICQKAYHSKFYLNQHLKIHSSDFVKKTYQCELCGKTFQSWKGVKKHADSVHEGKKYKCDLCEKEVTCLQSLKNHKKIHSGEKSFVCDICGKGFIALNNLIVHERIHSGEKPYKCDQCDKSFSQQSTLKVHKRSHTGEKPYQCYLCNKRFITHSHMKKHEKTHRQNV